MKERMGFRLVSSHTKGVFPGESFVVSKRWVALGGADSQSARPPKPGHQKYRKGENRVKTIDLVNGCQTDSELKKKHKPPHHSKPQTAPAKEV